MSEDISKSIDTSSSKLNIDKKVTSPIPKNVDLRVQLVALLWKNYLLKIRNKRDLLIEFLVPTIAALFAILTKEYLTNYGNFILNFLAYLVSGNCCRFTL